MGHALSQAQFPGEKHAANWQWRVCEVEQWICKRRFAYLVQAFYGLCVRPFLCFLSPGRSLNFLYATCTSPSPSRAYCIYYSANSNLYQALPSKLYRVSAHALITVSIGVINKDISLN